MLVATHTHHHQCHQISLLKKIKQTHSQKKKNPCNIMLMMLRAIYFYNFSCRAISPPLGTTYYSNQFKHTVTLNIIYKLTFCQIIYIKIFADSMVMMLLKFHYMYYRSLYVYRFKRNYIFCKYLNYFKF